MFHVSLVQVEGTVCTETQGNTRSKMENAVEYFSSARHMSRSTSKQWWLFFTAYKVAFKRRESQYKRVEGLADGDCFWGQLGVIYLFSSRLLVINLCLNADHLCMERMSCGQTVLHSSHEAFQSAATAPKLEEDHVCFSVIEILFLCSGSLERAQSAPGWQGIRRLRSQRLR